MSSNQILENNEYWQNIQNYKEKYYGAQDEHFKNNYPKNNSVNLIYQKTIILEAYGVVGENRRCNFSFPELVTNKLVYKNLKLNRNFDDVIHKCEISCNGSIIDHVWGRTFNTLRYLYNIEDATLIPFYFNMNNEHLPNNTLTQVNMQFLTGNLDDFELSVDIFEIDDENFDENNYIYDNIIVQCQYTGPEVACNGSSAGKYKLNFNHVMDYILLSIPDTNVTRVILQLDGYNAIDLSTENLICYDNHYIIPLTKSLNQDNINTYGINFSRCDNTILCIWYDAITNASSNVYIYGISHNAIKTQNKMAGLMYSK